MFDWRFYCRGLHQRGGRCRLGYRVISWFGLSLVDTPEMCCLFAKFAITAINSPLHGPHLRPPRVWRWQNPVCAAVFLSEQRRSVLEGCHWKPVATDSDIWVQHRTLFYCTTTPVDEAAVFKSKFATDLKVRRFIYLESFFLNCTRTKSSVRLDRNKFGKSNRGVKQL